MRQHTRSLAWHGETFHFQPLQAPNSNPLLWAVSRHGEFIGTMPCSTEVTTKDFEVRSLQWLDELLGGRDDRVRTH